VKSPAATPIKGPIARRNRPLRQAYFDVAYVHRLAQMRCACTHLAAEHRVLRLRDFLLRRNLAFTVGHGFDCDSVFAKLSPLQPAIFAAVAGRRRMQRQPLRLLRVTY